MNDDFTIVLFGADGKIVTGSKDLFPNYLNLSEDKVAASNTWYQTWAAAETYRQNLKLTYEFMLNIQLIAFGKSVWKLMIPIHLKSKEGPCCSS